MVNYVGRSIIQLIKKIKIWLLFNSITTAKCKNSINIYYFTVYVHLICILIIFYFYYSN